MDAETAIGSILLLLLLYPLLGAVWYIFVLGDNLPFHNYLYCNLLGVIFGPVLLTNDGGGSQDFDSLTLLEQIFYVAVVLGILMGVVSLFAGMYQQYLRKSEQKARFLLKLPIAFGCIAGATYFTILALLAVFALV